MDSAQWPDKKGNNMENKKTKILVVDDEKDVVEILKHALTNKGYEIKILPFRK